MADHDQKMIFEKLSERATAEGKDFYLDPATGYQVATSQYLRERGQCCESGCRHCPYRKSTHSKI